MLHLALDSSRQVGDQFLISDSPQTTFGRIGEWATSNLQPCTSVSGMGVYCLVMLVPILQLGRPKQSGQSALPDTCHGTDSISQPWVYKASALTVAPQLLFWGNKIRKAVYVCME